MEFVNECKLLRSNEHLTKVAERSGVGSPKGLR
nr:MAG TPA: hypothetical protein [Caudoviricetes sp.]